MIKGTDMEKMYNSRLYGACAAKANMAMRLVQELMDRDDLLPDDEELGDRLWTARRTLAAIRDRLDRASVDLMYAAVGRERMDEIEGQFREYKEQERDPVDRIVEMMMGGSDE